MDPLGDLLTTRPIQTGWELTFELYLSWQLGFIDNKNRQFGNSSVWTQIWTRSDGPEPLLTLGLVDDLVCIISRCYGTVEWFSTSYTYTLFDGSLFHCNCNCVSSSWLCMILWVLRLFIKRTHFVYLQRPKSSPFVLPVPCWVCSHKHE
jgi:hypothetical protein